ncbi:ABC transporter permease [Dietzia psychralcaliphila]|uniref:ABC transporter permease n=1 Tax=Dietzia psychralcaliphila TaxID=139021 RepID=UPI000D4BAC12|nr:ABC transporter permease [Dietzia psychralcaliphila]PTM88161.1 nitrate/nitrite transport system permease protein [Dietzia psychralcaliphila]
MTTTPSPPRSPGKIAPDDRGSTGADAEDRAPTTGGSRDERPSAWNSLVARLSRRGSGTLASDRAISRDRALAALILFVTTAVFIGLWNMATSGNDGGLAPTPAATLRSAIEILSDPFYREGINSVGVFWHLLASLQRVLTGFLVAAVIAIPLGFLLGSVRSARWGLDPIIQILRPVSPLAWLPLGLALLRDAERTALFVIIMSALWPLLLNTIEGVRSVNPLHLQLARTVEAGRWRVIRSILLPSALPQMITGLRLSLSTSWLVIIAAEMLVGGRGMGYFVWNMWNKLDIPAICVAILIIGLVGLALDRAVSALHKVVPHA